MIEFNRRRQTSALAGLPGLAAQIDVEGHEPVRGTLVDIGDGRVVIDVATAAHAAALASAATARLTVHAPGVRFEATAAPAGSVHGHAVALVVDAVPSVHRRTA